MHAIVLSILGYLALSGCVHSPVIGALYTEVQGPIAATSTPAGNLRGESCAMSILGLVATGDASIDAARKNAGITQVTSVDHKTVNYLFVYTKFCTIVYGRKAKSE